MMNFKKVLLLFCMTILIFNCNKKDNEIVFNLASGYNTLDPHLFTEMVGVPKWTQQFMRAYLYKIRMGITRVEWRKTLLRDNNKLTFKVEDNAKWSDECGYGSGLCVWI